MPGADGLEAAAALRAELPDVRVAHAHHVRPAGLPAPRDGGRAPRGSCSRTRPPTSSRARSARAIAGERVVDPGLAAAALSEGESPLTAREQRGARRARARHVAEIAAALHLSPGTVRNYLSAIMELGAQQPHRGGYRIRKRRAWL